MTYLSPIADNEIRTPWSEALAEEVARKDGIGELTERHWRVIRTLRQHYIQYGAMPPMRTACLLNDDNPHCVEELFHDPREAWQIAGLPDPGEEAKAYT